MASIETVIINAESDDFTQIEICFTSVEFQIDLAQGDSVFIEKKNIFLQVFILVLCENHRSI